MGFLEDMAGKALGGAAGNQGSGDMVSAVLGMINNQGGIGGLVQAFQNKGLGGLAASWVGTGPNLPATPDQVQAAVGSNAITEIAEKLGLPHNVVIDQLTALLPGIIDHLTPNGQVPQGMGSIGLEMLQGMLSKRAGQ